MPPAIRRAVSNLFPQQPEFGCCARRPDLGRCSVFDPGGTILMVLRPEMAGDTLRLPLLQQVLAVGGHARLWRHF
jgi:hypothetical protein